MWEKEPFQELSVKAMVLVINETKAGLGPRKARKGRSSMKLMRLKAMTMVWMI